MVNPNLHALTCVFVKLSTVSLRHSYPSNLFLSLLILPTPSLAHNTEVERLAETRELDRRAIILDTPDYNRECKKVPYLDLGYYVEVYIGSAPATNRVCQDSVFWTQICEYVKVPEPQVHKKRLYNFMCPETQVCLTQDLTTGAFDPEDGNGPGRTMGVFGVKCAQLVDEDLGFLLDQVEKEFQSEIMKLPARQRAAVLMKAKTMAAAKVVVSGDTTGTKFSIAYHYGLNGSITTLGGEKIYSGHEAIGTSHRHIFTMEVPSWSNFVLRTSVKFLTERPAHILVRSDVAWV